MAEALILASGSEARAALLRAAGVPVGIVRPALDETALKAALRAEGASPREVADALAECKAAKVSAKRPGRLVLGADQVLSIDGEMLDKPADLEEAADHLRRLRGRRHDLLSAAVICEDGRPVWRNVGRARLAMREFSEGFLAGYLAQEGEVLLESVGAYRIEAAGSQLFTRVEGDYFTVLGLPLLEVLGYLRVRGICSE